MFVDQAGKSEAGTVWRDGLWGKEKAHVLSTAVASSFGECELHGDGPVGFFFFLFVKFNHLNCF